jgi:hypothetical protein
MRYSFEAIINASDAGKTIVIHAFPGPAGTLEDPGGMFPIRPSLFDGATTGPFSAKTAQSSQMGTTRTEPEGVTLNNFHVAAWSGPILVPKSADGCRAAAATKLVESLAPFLIVVTERVFFGYGWFYNLEDGEQCDLLHGSVSGGGTIETSTYIPSCPPLNVPFESRDQTRPQKAPSRPLSHARHTSP